MPEIEKVEGTEEQPEPTAEQQVATLKTELETKGGELSKALPLIRDFSNW